MLWFVKLKMVTYCNLKAKLIGKTKNERYNGKMECLIEKYFSPIKWWELAFWNKQFVESLHLWCKAKQFFGSAELITEILRTRGRLSRQESRLSLRSNVTSRWKEDLHPYQADSSNRSTVSSGSRGGLAVSQYWRIICGEAHLCNHEILCRPVF